MSLFTFDPCCSHFIHVCNLPYLPGAVMQSAKWSLGGSEATAWAVSFDIEDDPLMSWVTIKSKLSFLKISCLLKLERMVTTFFFSFFQQKRWGMFLSNEMWSKHSQGRHHPCSASKSLKPVAWPTTLSWNMQSLMVKHTKAHALQRSWRYSWPCCQR